MLHRGVWILMALVLIACAGLLSSRSFSETARTIPPPAIDMQPEGQADTEVAVLAGGCFWGVQGVFQHVNGVTSAVSGYAGGDKSAAQYQLVGTGSTGHAESVRVTFDPKKISYGRILQIYFSVAHDPTELNRQGPDAGTQYRSAIFPTSPEQSRIAKAYITELNQAHAFDAAIVTKIEPDKAFFPAEDYHQDFLAHNPTYAYIAINDLPKVASLKRLFPDLYREEPVLVSASHNSN